MNAKDFEKKARAYALKNAVAHSGKAQQGAVISGLFNDGLKKNEVGKYVKDISKIVAEVNKLSLEDQEKELEEAKGNLSEREVREGLPELPNVKKSGVIMRFAPSASGPLHFGHALTAAFSYLYVKKYGGKFYVRIEDTNPENIYKPSYKMIEQEIKWLFGKEGKIVIQSDRMEFYYKYAEKLVKAGAAYVCTCDGEKFREFVFKKKACPCRKLSVKENLERWKKMLKEYDVGEAVLRFRSSMSDKNPAMRDFPLARVNTASHPRVGKKYRVWPLMNLAVSVDDIEMKMTHVIRGKDHRDNEKRQRMIYKVLGKEKQFPWTGFLGRWKFKDLELSSTKITQGIKEGKYSGWDDPKLPTIASLKKKGYTPEMFWKFAEHVGFSENDKVISKKDFFELLDSFK